jgi:MoxR-like ATPase
MKRLSDEELVLYYYGEAPDPKEIERALESSKEERRRYAELSRVLDTVDEPPIPEKSAAYGASVWRRLEPQLEKKSWLGSWSWEALVPRREWALAGAMAMLLVVAFLTGRFWPRPETVAVVAEQPAASPERILGDVVAGAGERTTERHLRPFARARVGRGAER